MKFKLKEVFYLFFIAKFIVIALEIASIALSLRQLRQGNNGFEPGSLSDKIAKDTASFFENQINASKIGLAHMLKELKVLFSYAFVAFMVIDTKGRTKIIETSKKKLGMLNPEFSLLLIFTYTISLVELYSKTFVLINSTYLIDQIPYPLDIALFFLVEIPCVLYLVLSLLKMFGQKLILVCYIAFLIDDLAGVFYNKGPNTSELMRISSEAFPERIQRLLNSEGLEEAIYRSKHLKDRRNAALVGFGRSRRIEVYGDFDIKSSEELHSIILHEIGHSIDDTMIKRRLFKYGVLLLEMGFLLWIYMRGSKAFGFSEMSTPSFFIIAFIMYLISVRPWIFMMFNIYTQRSELFADEFAKANGYGERLSRALFRITLEHNARIDPSFLFHAMTSLHPSTQSRIERCSQ